MIHITFIAIGLVFLAKLFSIQVLSDAYKLAAEKNIVQPVVEYPHRGAICDRHGAFLAYNVPIYDLMVIPKEVKHLDISAFCQDFDISLPTFHRLLEKAKAYSYVKPSVFIKNISQETWAQVQDHVASYLGFFVQVRTVRQYPTPTLANTLGYLGEIDAQQLTSDLLSYYRKGDMIGISGLEKSYEKVLRGECGVRYQVSDARGIVQGSFKGGSFDRASVPGQDLQITVDTSLQAYGEWLMENKLGSIVAIVPQTGEILALVSSPSYDPNLLTGKNFGGHFAALSGCLSPSFPQAYHGHVSPRVYLQAFPSIDRTARKSGL